MVPSGKANLPYPGPGSGPGRADLVDLCIDGGSRLQAVDLQLSLHSHLRRDQGGRWPPCSLDVPGDLVASVLIFVSGHPDRYPSPGGGSTCRGSSARARPVNSGAASWCSHRGPHGRAESALTRDGGRQSMCRSTMPRPVASTPRSDTTHAGGRTAAVFDFRT